MHAARNKECICLVCLVSEERAYEVDVSPRKAFSFAMSGGLTLEALG